MTNTLSIQSVSFGYSKKQLLQNISLDIKQGEVACLLGPSGCGKSSLLRLIAGFEVPNSGHISINDETMFAENIYIQPQNRNVGMLFQDLALFPHLTVIQNIAYGLKDKNTQRVNELLELCKISQLGKRYPHQLSGGQKQRVALARAMAPKPQLILLDEPFSSVDQGLQNELVHEVKRMLLADDSTVLWVTHGLNEACAIADKVGLMLEGKLLQWSSPQDLYNHPEHVDVIKFLNHASLISAEVDGDGNIATGLGQHQLNNLEDMNPNQSIQVSVAHHDLQVSDSGKENAKVVECVYQGSHFLLTVELDSRELVKVMADQFFEMNKRVFVGLKQQALRGYQSE